MRKAVLCFLLSLVLLLGFSGVGFAQGDPDNPYGYKITQDEFAEYNAATESCDTPSLECLVRYTTRFIAMEWVNDISGQSIEKVELIEPPPDEDDAPTDEGEEGASLNRSPSGLIGGIFTLASGMYSYKPANTGRYVADVMNSAGLATPAYAQGLGFASLDPILNLWKMFRNVAYFFFIVIFITIGFMIMFRAKISGQAVVTAQQAIPSVIISLILVTFSYAIAGFMIDLMYLLMFMIVGLFEGLSADSNAGFNTVQSSDLISFNIMNLIGFLFWNSLGESGDNIAISQTMLSAAFAGEGLISGVGGFLGGLTLTIVVTIAALIACVKLFFELLKSYATIVLSVVFAPLVLMMGAFPGKNVFGLWLKGIIGNLIAFPTVLLLIIMFIEFTKGGDSLTSEGGFMPPFLIGAGQAGIVGPLMGLAIILAMPEIVKKVKEVSGAGDGGFGSMLAGWAGNSLKQGFPLGGRIALSGVGAGIGGAVGAPLGAMRGFGRGAASGFARFARNPNPITLAGMVVSPVAGAVAGAGRGVIGGIRTGGPQGVRAAANISRSIGANQPDYLNPLTNLMDQNALTAQELESQRRQQELEDVFDRNQRRLRQGT